MSDLVLSPMDGFSDLPFRTLTRKLGSAISYTEFINAIDVLQNQPQIEQKLAFAEFERPIAFQIFDDDPDRLVKAALKLAERRPDIIDVNMGCSAKNVSGRGAGAGLLRTPSKIAEIFQKLTKTLDIPVTGKIRIGWDEDQLNYMEVARIIEDNGAQLLAVHGRTKKQGYGGNANWDAIAEIKHALHIPVIGNGDVKTVADIDKMKAHTGCDGVMIARAAIGNPWIFSRIDREQVPQSEVRRVVLSHLHSMLEFYGTEQGLILFRKHVTRYISPYPLSKEERVALLTCESTQDFIVLLNQIVPESEAQPG